MRSTDRRKPRPDRKRNKHDAADAEAICEAVQRPTMRFVPVKTADQQAAVLHRGRERLVRQRTGLVNDFYIGSTAGGNFEIDSSHPQTS
jgi:transposase